MAWDAKKRKKAEHDFGVTAYRVFQQAVGETPELPQQEESAATKTWKSSGR